MRRQKAAESAKTRPSSIIDFFRNNSVETWTLENESTASSSTDVVAEEVVVPTRTPGLSNLSDKNTLRPTVFCDDDRVKAEVLWALHFVNTNASFRSCENISGLFSQMFPDSSIASNFSCGDTKARYLVTHGLKPYFLQQLKDKVKDGACVLLFDESLNKKMQQKQMDIYVRFWNGHVVESRYFTSVFMGHATAKDIKLQLKKSLDSFNIDMKCVIQLGMDGPNVNWKLFKDFQAELELNSNVKLLNVGSCGLHVVHGAYSAGMNAAGWELDTFLSSTYFLLKDTPARREDFVAETGCEIFPPKFAPHRWLENVPVLEIILEILPHLRKYMQAVQQKKYHNPGTKSFGIVQSECVNPLMEVKLQFALTVAKQLQPFLKQYQGDEPMLPFLVPDLMLILKQILWRFLTTDCLSKLKQASDFKIDLLSNENNHRQVDLGFLAERLLKTSPFKNLSERGIFSLRKDAKKCLLAIVSKILDKSSLKFKLARSIVCLDPAKMHEEESREQFTELVSQLVSSHRIPSSDADGILIEFDSYKEHSKDSFIRTEDRLD